MLRWPLITTRSERAMKPCSCTDTTSRDERFPQLISAIVPASPWRNRTVPKQGVFPESVVISAGVAIEVCSFKPDNWRRYFPHVWPVSHCLHEDALKPPHWRRGRQGRLETAAVFFFSNHLFFPVRKGHVNWSIDRLEFVVQVQMKSWCHALVTDNERERVIQKTGKI